VGASRWQQSQLQCQFIRGSSPRAGTSSVAATTCPGLPHADAHAAFRLATTQAGPIVSESREAQDEQLRPQDADEAFVEDPR
jgi:hypothetical protein